MTRLMNFVVIGLLFAGCAATSETGRQRALVKSVTVSCPVTGGEMGQASAPEISEYGGQTYYFCCKGCKESFDQDPEKYIGDR